MPEISSFYGISIYMYFKDNESRHIPHFHASYAGNEMSFDFDGNILAKTSGSDIPNKKIKLIVAWAEIHREELDILWETMQNEDRYFKIEGLR